MSPGHPRVVVCTFEEMGVATAYDVWRLRQDVFVVEQECAYPDLDGRDDEAGTRHLLLVDADPPRSGTLHGYLRVLEEAGFARIGRVVLRREARGRGLADRLLLAALREVGERPCVLAAQSPLARWYAGFGFEVCGPEFLEDGIAHLPMRRDPGTRRR